MRHFWSLLAGMAIAPVVWLLLALGLEATENAPTSQGGLPTQLIVGGCVLLGVGLLAGLMASLRTSPTGATFAGLVFIVCSTFMWLEPARGLRTFTTNWVVAGYPINLAKPVTSGVLAFAGGLLMMSAFSGSRWRGRRIESDEDNWHPLPPEEDTWSYR